MVRAQPVDMSCIVRDGGVGGISNLLKDEPHVFSVGSDEWHRKPAAFLPFNKGGSNRLEELHDPTSWYATDAFNACSEASRKG